MTGCDAGAGRRRARRARLARDLRRPRAARGRRVGVRRRRGACTPTRSRRSCGRRHCRSPRHERPWQPAGEGPSLGNRDPRGGFPMSALEGPRADPRLERLAAAMVAAAGRSTDNFAVDAGYTYFGQFVDHDVTVDRARRASAVAATGSRLAVRARAPARIAALRLRAGPLHGARLRIGGGPTGVRLRARGPAARRRRPRADRRSAQRREPDHRAAAPAVHPLPQPGRRPRRGPEGRGR